MTKELESLEVQVSMIEDSVPQDSLQAARLKGARTIVTGISDAVAETIVDLGIDWSEIETMRNLQAGITAALGEKER